MKRSAHDRLVGLATGALLALLATGIVLPSSARAGCGSFHINSSTGSASNNDGLELLRIAAPNDDAQPDRSAPCTGALCSGNPAPPLSAAPTVLPPTGGQWAIPAFPSSPAGPGSSVFPVANATLRAVERPDSIFHPPRLSFRALRID